MSDLLDFRTSDEPRFELVDSRDPRQALARYLRLLREERWPNVKITQPQLAQGLGGDRPLSVPLISSWESASNPKIPPIPRLEAYATFFATERTVAQNPPRLLTAAEMTEPEQRARDELLRELMTLRKDALRATGTGTPPPTDGFEALSIGPWRFDDGKPITIVCAELPPEFLERMPYTDRNDPDFVELYTYSDLDSLVELHGHLRAANSTSQVNYRSAPWLQPDDYTTHFVTLGGVDWNPATDALLSQLRLPVRQVRDPAGDVYFEVEADGQVAQHRPQLDNVQGREILREDVALFARAVSPYNQLRTVSICNGMYSPGTYGAVRALTDARFRDRNAAYLQDRFGNSETYCLLSRVKVQPGAALTPDWTDPENRLFEWSK